MDQVASHVMPCGSRIQVFGLDRDKPGLLCGTEEEGLEPDGESCLFGRVSVNYTFV
jgi:hypothetical protein